MLLQRSYFERASRSLAKTGLCFGALGRLWALLVVLGAFLGASWVPLGLSGSLWATLGGSKVPFWVDLGAILVTFGCHFGAQGV